MKEEEREKGKGRRGREKGRKERNGRAWGMEGRGGGGEEEEGRVKENLNRREWDSVEEYLRKDLFLVCFSNGKLVEY